MEFAAAPLDRPEASASTLHLPAGNWSNVLECLCAHFPQVPPETWRDRFARGRVLDSHGLPLDEQTPHRENLKIHYFREVADEVVIPFEARLLHVDQDLVIADKPHFLAVLPSGQFVEHTLLRRLMRELDNPHLVPLHRIDRDTAGLVMFSASPRSRSQYQALFREHRIEKRYQALAPALPSLEFPLVHRSHMHKGEPFFRMAEHAGAANSETRIDVLDRTGPIWRYSLTPITGRKHQLRVHTASIGAAIVNDPYYPELTTRAIDDFSAPLKLLAQGLRFIDPLSGKPRHFESQLTL